MDRSEYAARLAAAVDKDLRRSLANYDPVTVATTIAHDGESVTVSVTVSRGELRQETFHLDEEVYHYRPDGHDPEQHAAWLSELFQEEHTDLVHRGRRASRGGRRLISRPPTEPK